MKPLEKSLRSKLENTVKDARDIAESAVKISLDHLGIKEAKPHSHLTDEERVLRRRLRSHGRQLGDRRDPAAETQETEKLLEETAYEHWHRMLFARFLAENNLLMYPDPDAPVPVSLEECEELAKDEGAKNGWELASRFACKMLPQIFRPDSPVFQINLPPEDQKRLEHLVTELPAETFKASDSLGWVYQFWQAKKKDEVNNSEVKIGARELPAVTQLFTEPYMVSFLLDNSLGAWWAGKRLKEEDFATAQSEEELREKSSLPGVPLEYLRFVKEDGKWKPAGGTFADWPEKLKDFKVLDPCCGSGHFLVAAMLMLAPMRMETEGLSAEEAIDAVLRENIHGLEIDERCVKLAAFALALTAWTYRGGGYRELPELNVACSGLSVSVAEEEWIKPAGDDPNLRLALKWLYKEFKDGPVLGSLLNPGKSSILQFNVEREKLLKLFKTALAKEKEEEYEAGVVAHGLAKTAGLIADKYHLVITNVPYLARGKQGEKLRDFCEKYYNEAKNDLATVFLERCLEFCRDGGTVSSVLPQNWLFLTTYKQLRVKLLSYDIWHYLAMLGPGAFETISGEVVKAILIILSTKKISDVHEINLFATDSSDKIFYGNDVSNIKTAIEKSEQIKDKDIQILDQKRQVKNPDARITLETTENIDLLEKYTYSYQGISPADFPRFGRCFWESYSGGEWCNWQSSVTETKYYAGREHILWLSEVKKKVIEEGTAYIRGEDSWKKNGIVVSAMSQLYCTLSSGYPSDTNVAVIVPHNQSNLTSIWCYCSSPEYHKAVRQIDQSLKVTNATLVKVPFDLDYWQKIASEKYPDGLPEPYSDDPTQWIFHGHPAKSAHPLQVAAARLLGYRWPAELDETMELSDEAKMLAKKCEDLLPYSDEDGIVCIPAVRGELSASDRLVNLLASAYGEEWNIFKIQELLDEADHKGKTLETYLRDKFFAHHCKIFHNRPFIWHIWDGLRDGFSVLVNYHKLDYKKLETLIYTYLGDWIKRQKDDISAGIDGSEERLAAAEKLKKCLELILEGEAPYDIFVRWKSLQEQPAGWNPDLNDGVRLNIRPFMTVTPVSKKDAGVLRDKPNITWGKDRGKDVESSPWYHILKGERINDYHLTLSEKKTCREGRNDR